MLVLPGVEVTKNDATTPGLLQRGDKHAGREIATTSSTTEVRTSQNHQGRSRLQNERSAPAAITGPHFGGNAEVGQKDETDAVGGLAKSRGLGAAVEMAAVTKGRVTVAGRMHRMHVLAVSVRTTGQTKGRLATRLGRSGLLLASGRA